jgi:hypothetical protein
VLLVHNHCCLLPQALLVQGGGGRMAPGRLLCPLGPGVAAANHIFMPSHAACLLLHGYGAHPSQHKHRGMTDKHVAWTCVQSLRAYACAFMVTGS